MQYQRRNIVLLCASVILYAASGSSIAQDRAAFEKKRQELKTEFEKHKLEGFEFEDQGDDESAKAKFGEMIAKTHETLASAKQLFPSGSQPEDRQKIILLQLDLSLAYSCNHEYAKAHEEAVSAWKLCEEIFPEEKVPGGNELSAKCLFTVGRTASQQDDFSTSEGWLRRAVSIRRKLCPADRSSEQYADLAETLFWYALVQEELRQPECKQSLEESIATLQQYLEAASKAGKIDEIKFLRDAGSWYDDAFPNLARICESRGEIDAAVQLNKQYVELTTRLHEKAPCTKTTIDVVQAHRSLGVLWFKQGHLDEAKRCSEKAKVLAEPLKDVQYFAHCHADLMMYEQMSGNLVAAKSHAERVLELQRKMFPGEKYPHGAAPLATTLNRYGSILHMMGDPKNARKYLEQGLEMRRKVLEQEKTPENRRALAISVAELANLLKSIGDTPSAGEYFLEVIQLFREVYPKDRHPAGHPELATSLQNMAAFRANDRNWKEAAEYGQQAVDMHEALAAAKYRTDKRVWATALANLGDIYQNLEDLPKAQKCLEQALSLYREYYPATRFPNGHPDEALCLQRLANVCSKQQQHAEAVQYSNRAVEIASKYYAPPNFPHGSPTLANIYFFNASTKFTSSKVAEAAAGAATAIGMDQVLAAHVLPGLSEAESLNYVKERLDLPAFVFSAWDQTKEAPDDLYELVWNRRGIVMRVIQQRNLAIRSTQSAELERVYREFEQASRNLGRAMLGGTPPAQLAKLTAIKEAKERAFTESIPGSDKLLNPSGRSFSELARKIPQDTVYIEFVREVPSSSCAPCYSAFVLSKNRPVAMVRLAETAAIDSVVSSFRTAVADGKPVSAETKQLRELVWEPVERAFPQGTSVAYICPDGSLTRVPWSMLPDQGSGVLLEKYALAVVPSGHLLLDQLSADDSKTAPGGSALVVGDLAFDQRKDVVTQTDSQPRLRAAYRGDEAFRWKPLPGTVRELEDILACSEGRDLSTLRGTEAGVSRVLHELPRVRWAHFATHGFFSAPEEHASAPSNGKSDKTEWKRSSAAARNPQLLSGIVLSGANESNKDGDVDLGILTAEAISMLPLNQLQLVVLSACETGAGDVADGEGVLGLQRAFHLAGARNVVASLWKVDDRATAVLMQMFYDNHWKKGKLPIVALREAQLALYRNPSLIENVDPGRERGINAAKTESIAKDKGVATTDPRLWAAFTLSGRGN